jgi:hypothetical protein
MASRKQIEANRLNALQSTGPRSSEGKARSSMNALQTGIDAKTQIIRGEIWDTLQELTAEYSGRFRPTTPEQRVLVDTLIDCDWLLRRFRAIETQLWEDAIDIYHRSLGETFSKYSDEFSRLQRRVDSTHRQYRNTLHELERLQAAEEAALATAGEPQAEPEPAPARIPVTSQKQTGKPQSGFVPPSPAGHPGGDPSEIAS